MASRAILAARNAQILADANAEMTVQEIADKHSLGYWAVRAVLRKHGVTAKRDYSKGNTISYNSLEILARLINTTDPMSKICDDFHISMSNLWQLMSRARTAGIRLHPDRPVGRGNRCKK